MIKNSMGKNALRKILDKLTKYIGIIVFFMIILLFCCFFKEDIKTAFTPPREKISFSPPKIEQSGFPEAPLSKQEISSKIPLFLFRNSHAQRTGKLRIDFRVS